MAVLYRCTTPTNRLCPCGRVARELRRADIAFSEVRVPQRRSRRAEVEALSGQSRVPLLVLDGDTICDSRRILEHLAWKGAQAEPGTRKGAGSVGNATPSKRLWATRGGREG
jgi:glutathione S-transferase